MRVLGALPHSAAAAHMRFELALPYSAGLRRAKRSGTFTDGIGVRYAGAEIGSVHLLRVVGKGAKERFVPLVHAVLEALGDNLQARGIPRDLLTCPVGTPLIPALSNKRDVGRVRREAAGHGTDADAALAALARQAKAILPDQLYMAVKHFFATETATALREDSPHALAFSEVSPHWLRHLCVACSRRWHEP